MDTIGTPVLKARGLRKEYGEGAGLVRAVDGVNLDVARGEMVAVTGPGRCGKSTLLHLLGGLHKPSGGERSSSQKSPDGAGGRWPAGWGVKSHPGSVRHREFS